MTKQQLPSLCRSAYHRIVRNGSGEPFHRHWLLLINSWPVEAPADWKRRMNRAETTAELESLHQAVKRGRPFGEEKWIKRTAKTLNLQFTRKTKAPAP